MSLLESGLITQISTHYYVDVGTSTFKLVTMLLSKVETGAGESLYFPLYQYMVRFLKPVVFRTPLSGSVGCNMSLLLFLGNVVISETIQALWK